MPDSPSDAPLPDDIDMLTDEAITDHAAIALYRSLIPCRPVMTHGPED